MKNLYSKNGLVFWSEKEIKIRKIFEEYFVTCIAQKLKEMNGAFDIIQVEASLLTPKELIAPNYTSDDIFVIDEELTLRPETTMGSYLYINELMNTHNERKVRFPICVWQHGKSFRNEQDKTLANMRLKEFYQLEFQVVYATSTANDYYNKLIPTVRDMIYDFIGPCSIVASDRLPDYSEQTMDIILDSNKMEIASISKRKDFPNALVTEIAIGTDRCVANFMGDLANHHAIQILQKI